MAVKAKSDITLSSIVDVSGTVRYYKLQSSTLAKPTVPTTKIPNAWTTTEPTYTSGSTNSLYTVDRTDFSDGTWSYSLVQLSSSYEAAKEAYNKAKNAEEAANDAAKTATNFMEYTDGTGLVIGDMTGDTLGKNSLIDAGGFAVRDGSTELARFGESDDTFIGTASEGAMANIGLLKTPNGDHLASIKTTAESWHDTMHADVEFSSARGNMKIAGGRSLYDVEGPAAFMTLKGWEADNDDISISFDIQNSLLYTSDPTNISTTLMTLKRGMMRGVVPGGPAWVGLRSSIELNADFLTLNGIGNVKLTETLVAGSTSVIFYDERIDTDSLFDIYTNVYGVNPTNVSQSGAWVTLTFAAQTSDVSVVLIVR